MKSVDTQSVELIGRNRLTEELIQAGLEVALPLRDRGIDLIAYADLHDKVESFSACPIQMKAATNKSFSITRKYEKFPNLIIAFVWGIGSFNDIETYGLTHPEAVAIGDEMGYTKTSSWDKPKGYYTTTRPSAKLLALLEPYRMTPEKWWEKIVQLQSR